MARREPLTREKILDAALEIAGAEGLDGLSMRRLAKALGVEAMALYNHVANKAEILDGLADRVFAQVPRADPGQEWHERVRTMAHAMYRLLSKHPVVPRAVVTDQANPRTLAALRPIDDMVGALFEAGFDDNGVRRALGTVNSVIYGSLVLSTVGFDRPLGGSADPEQLDVIIRTVNPETLPHFSRLLKVLPGSDPEQDFSWALDRVIGGLIAESERL
ncbi:TetR/AcrR family transcriptional regulator [Pseudonocardia sp. TRM90224]|uniref:TetR/AcrR family transcriptional regulator n=1 Tax=Pseudonocardia sp. TRM90224 TaxID=2812678 RepID=UPI001E36A7C2|nr:TetR/AcrR family transcriptional regulator C-terminal domain-containing protein [Pseudonocardia sp. TRM90224]